MKNTLDKIREAFRQLDGNNIKEDESLIIIGHHEDDFLIACAGKPLHLTALLATSMEKDSDMETIVRLALFAFDAKKYNDSKPENEPETEAENEK
jgi:hypothetical protein